MALRSLPRIGPIDDMRPIEKHAQQVKGKRDGLGEG